MKKVLAILSIVALASCGGSQSTTETTDSTAVKVDTVTVVIDTTATEVKTDGGSTATPVK